MSSKHLLIVRKSQWLKLSSNIDKMSASEIIDYRSNIKEKSLSPPSLFKGNCQSSLHMNTRLNTCMVSG